MNKITKIIAAAVASASILTCTAVSASAKCMYFTDVDEPAGITLSRISSSTVYNCYPGYGGEFLIKDRKIKKGRLFIGVDEILTVCRGTTLTLNGSAHIDGTLFIQEGGKLVVNGGRVMNCGNIICDGDICFSEYGTMDLFPESTFVVSKKGSLEYNGDYYERSKSANMICVGEFTSELLSDNEVAAMKAKPVAAIVDADRKTTKVTNAKLLGKMTAKFGNYKMSGESKSSYITMLFDNGSSLHFTLNGDGVRYVAGDLPGTLADLADQTLELNKK